MFTAFVIICFSAAGCGNGSDSTADGDEDTDGMELAGDGLDADIDAPDITGDDEGTPDGTDADEIELPPPPVGITTPAFQDKVVFGFATYEMDGNPELGSLFQWEVNGEVVEEGTLSKIMLVHFNGDSVSENGVSPVEESGIEIVADGKFGGGVRIDEGDTLAYPLPEGMSVSSGTIEMWVKPDWNSGNPAETSHTLLSDFFDEDNGFSLHYLGNANAGDLHFLGRDSGGDIDFSKKIVWKENEWHHVAFTWYEGTTVLYVDGQPSRSRVYRRTDFPEMFFIGSNVGGGNAFNGVIDELRIGSRQLSFDEIHESYAAGREYFDNERMLDLAGMSVDDALVFIYTPRNAAGTLGDPIRSDTTVVEEFISTIEVNVSDAIHETNRKIMGMVIPYGDERNPGDCCYPDCGDDQCRLGSRVWLDGAGTIDPQTLAEIFPLNLGSTRIKLEGFSTPQTDQVDRFIQFSRAQEIADIDNVLLFSKIDNIEDRDGVGVIDHILSSEYGIKYFEILNEPTNMYGIDFVHDTYGSEPEMIAQFINSFGPQIKARIPDAKVGGYVVSYSVPQASGGYVSSIHKLLDEAGDNLDFIAVHEYAGYNVPDDDYAVETLYRNFLNAMVRKQENLRWYRNILDFRYPGEEKEIIMTEWNLHSQLDHTFDYERVWHSMAAAVIDSSYLNDMLQQGLADSAQFHEFSHGGWGSPIGRNYWETAAPYLVFYLYAEHLKNFVIHSAVETLSFDAPGQGAQLEPMENIPSLSVLATIDGSRDVSLFVTNREISRAVSAWISLGDYIPDPGAEAYTLDERTGECDELLESRIAGPCRTDPFYFQPDNITIENTSISGVSSSFEYTFPPHSITVLVLTESS
ncbi:MAG: LamG-like jellyroll fold domain-containing protein [Pseudomonadota bacterium]